MFQYTYCQKIKWEKSAQKISYPGGRGPWLTVVSAWAGGFPGWTCLDTGGVVSAAVAGAVVAAVAPSGLCSEDVLAAGPASDPALAPSFSVDVDEGPFTLAIMSKIKRQEGGKKKH